MQPYNNTELPAQNAVPAQSNIMPALFDLRDQLIANELSNAVNMAFNNIWPLGVPSGEFYPSLFGSPPLPSVSKALMELYAQVLGQNMDTASDYFRYHLAPPLHNAIPMPTEGR